MKTIIKAVKAAAQEFLATSEGNVDPVKAIKDTSQEFLATREGRRYYEKTHFNWDDVAVIPDEILARHGISEMIIEDAPNIIVDHDERVAETPPEPEEENADVVILYAPDEYPPEVWIVRKDKDQEPRILLFDADDRIAESGLLLEELFDALGIKVKVRVIQVEPATLAGQDTWNWEEIADAWLQQQALCDHQARYLSRAKQ